jgi:hypothetical protein
MTEKWAKSQGVPAFESLFCCRSASGGFWRILLQKAKIEPRQKSRESRFLSVSIAEGLFGIDTKVRGRFCVKRYGPSRREAQHASAVLKISVDQPKNTFATKSRRVQPIAATHSANFSAGV